MTLGARGISVLFASGDVCRAHFPHLYRNADWLQGGVRGSGDVSSQCVDNVFIPTFPSTCPFVTSVGATQGFAPEQAANFSSGGFSNYFPAPSYQTAAIAQFLETVPSDFAGVFNATGRGYPDISLQGVNYLGVVGGVTELGTGTSASSPAFAAILALINDRLIAAGKPTLGFLNPFLYSPTASKAFTDITIGHNGGMTCTADSVRLSCDLFMGLPDD
jgi:tripeptidyl-peptidase-1